MIGLLCSRLIGLAAPSNAERVMLRALGVNIRVVAAGI